MRPPEHRPACQRCRSARATAPEGRLPYHRRPEDEKRKSASRCTPTSGPCWTPSRASTLPILPRGRASPGHRRHSRTSSSRCGEGRPSAAAQVGARAAQGHLRPSCGSRLRRASDHGHHRSPEPCRSANLHRGGEPQEACPGGDRQPSENGRVRTTGEQKSANLSIWLADSAHKALVSQAEDRNGTLEIVKKRTLNW